MFNFDNPPSRANTYSFKWKKYEGKDIIPAWVADMEFECASPILDAAQAEISTGALGYTLPDQYTPAKDAVKRWLADKHDWDVDADWIVWVPGVVPAFNVFCKAFSQPNSKVIVQAPNYPPLLAAPKLNGLARQEVGTILVDGRWTLDFSELETQAADPLCKQLILCNPMNPVGSVLNHAELERIAQICERHDLILCSDEVHCDLILEPDIKHIPAGRLASLKHRSVTLMAASKTFNIAGLGTAFAIIPNKQIRQRFINATMGMLPWVSKIGLVATEAAFTQCDNWHSALLEYLRGNRDLLVEQINAINGLSMVTPQATYLGWIDATGLGEKNVQQWAEQKGVGPSPGTDFNAPDFFRINYGCSRRMLESIVKRLGS
ncbi:aminotransferase class I/II-fold pyridoxal phosphate-dependent enzyme [Alteromonas ponticola]|uniref:cysteine-S-conjugate beta-lyase n=1 Tax=Alteromonas aquimaris TaxID=2998417 RepID=A0ABT3P3Y7_9ALTE|nr:aminotransferase class I/II-fold pyridoxal phosphate-dependent enzyme [Alteromonas aquimaris]MCW8107489.1 aminotransferase class I/II-fold pyridoxal phosphate-dependent enzyme [Alteromonas aquimaris]